jgi:hypothetical protein
MRFRGKVALITAAASGRATANIIGREGGRIVAVDIASVWIHPLRGSRPPAARPTPIPRMPWMRQGAWSPTPPSAFEPTLTLGTYAPTTCEV